MVKSKVPDKCRRIKYLFVKRGKSKGKCAEGKAWRYTKGTYVLGNKPVVDIVNVASQETDSTGYKPLEDFRYFEKVRNKQLYRECKEHLEARSRATLTKDRKTIKRARSIYKRCFVK